MKKLYTVLTFLSVILTVQNTNSFGQAPPAILTYTTVGTTTYTVPIGVASLTITAKGGKGGTNGDSVSHPLNGGGAGACAVATYTVTPGLVANVYVGGRGDNGVTSAGGPTNGGFNGGGKGQFVTSSVSGGGGGGASDVRFSGTALSDRVIVGAGGGGGGSACGGGREAGGNGGGYTGVAGVSTCPAIAPTVGGGGATTGAPGAGGTATGGGSPGSPGVVGIGGNAGGSTSGGGGGGGYYGGGGGQFGGGGGGSSYTGSGTSASATANCNIGGGVVTIQENCIPQTITATRTQICPYETLTLSDNVSGGTWSSANPAVGTIDPTTGVFSGTFPGSPVVQTVAITYTAGPCKLSFTVTVNPLPATITGSKAICSGLTSQLSNATPAGTWSSTGVGSVDAFGVLSGTTGASPGTGTVTYTEPVHGCYITTPTTVNPLPAPITGTFQACVGLTQTLSDATPGGTFSNVNPFLTGVAGNVVTGLAFGVDTIIYTLTATGCVATHEFTVNPLPATPVGASAICQGNTTTLNDVDGPGTWSTSATAASVVSGTGVVTGLNVGLAQSTAIITYTLNTTGCINTFVVSVNPLPVNTYSITPTTGHYCAGTLGVDVQLTNTQLGFQYDLYNGATLVSTLLGGGGPLDFGLQLSGTYHIVATDNTYFTGCTSNMTGVANIIVDPLPNPISGAPGVCAGSSTTLSDAGGGTWASSDPSIATINSSGVVTGVASSRGTVTITYTLPVTGCIMTKTMTIAPNYPIYGITTACSGGTISLSDTSDFSFGGGAWSGIGVTVVGAGSTATVTKVGTGTGSVSYTSSAGCVATTTVTFTPLDAITGPVPAVVCEGSVITLSNPNTGGTWSSSVTCAAVVDPFGNVTGISSTLCASTATITYTLPTGCAATLTVTINPTPAAIGGTAVTCEGGFTALSDALSGGVWSNSCTAFFSVSPAGVVSAVGAGTCTISYTMPTTGCMATITYTVNPLPGVSGPIPVVVCVGYGVTLTGSPGTGTWSSSNPAIGSIGSTSGVFVGVSGGVTSIIYTLPTGCSRTVLGTVNANPAIPVITVGKDTLCGGSSITLTDATAGGTWSTLSGGTISTITSPPPVVTGTFTGPGGVDTVFYTTAAGCRSAKGIFVRTLNAIVGPTKMCVGQTTLFTEAAAGGTWSSSNPAIGSVDALGNVTARAPGIITIKDTFSTGCFATMTVTVYALPAPITGTPLTICNFSTGTLSDATGGGTWTASGDATVNASGVVTGANILGGTATITYTVTISGCTATAVVSVLPLDTIHGPSSICYGTTATLTDGTAGGSWSSSDVTIATIGTSSGVVSAGTITPPGGVVTISYTTTAGCVATKSFTVLPVGIITPGSVCLNSSVTMSDNLGLSGGTWTSTATTISIGSSSGVVTGTTVGTAVITYTVPVTGCQTQILFTINPLPAPITGDFEICKGTTTVLSDADAFGGWTSSITTVGTIDPTTGTAGGVTAGTTTITYKFTLTGCYTTASLVVDDVQPIGGIRSVCVGGNTTTLSNVIGGGTWSNSCTAFYTIGTSSGVVTGVSAGTCTVTYTNPNGCTSVATVTVSPAPSAITGAPFTVCRGQTITVTDVTAGGGTWTASGNVTVPPLSSGSSVVVSGTAAGTGTVTFTTGTGCFATQTITVNAFAPIVTAPFRVCLGSSITLSDAVTGGVWSRGATAIDINSGTGVVTTNALGTSVVTYTLGSCVANATVTVNPLPSSIFGTSAVCQGSTVTLTDATSGGVWSSTGSVSVVGAGTTGTVTGVTGPGTGTISYTLPTTCAATYVVTVNPLPGPITGVRSICVGAGNSTTLTDLTAGGTWSSSNIGVGTIGTVTSNSAQVVSVGVVGTTTISYTLSSTGCAITAIVSVNPFPAAITGPTQVCVNSTITVSNSLSTGVWSITPGARATITPAVPPFSAVIFGVSAGTATISYAFPTGCAATQTLTVLPQPLAFITPIGDTNICPGSFVALTANTGTSLSYQWYDAAGYSIITGAISSSYIAAPPVITRYAVKVTDGSTGCSDTSLAMMVSPIPTSASITFSPATTVCAGTVVTLTASGIAATGYQWEVGGTPIAGATAVTYTPTATGTYDAVVTNATGCSAKSGTVSITINPAPLGTITVTGPATFCAGDSVLLSGEAGTGLTYQWRNIGGPIPGATNMTYYAKLGDDYRVSVTNSSGCSAISGIVTVTVKALPTGAALSALKPLVFCTGGSVTIHASADADPTATYRWYENDLPIGTTGPDLTVTTSGRYKALVTDPATGCTAFTPEDTTVLVVTPIIAPVSSASFCWGGSAALKAVIVGGITPTYQWYIGGVPIAGATSNIYPAVKGGSYTVKITSTCSTTSLPIDVTENPLPNPLLTFDGAKIATQKYYVSYQWFKDLVAISGATKYNLSPSTNGKYKVSVTDTNGCQSISDYYILTGWTPHVNGVQALASGEIRVYPNPAQNMIHIESATEVRAVITSIDGRVLIEQSKAKDIDIKTLANGIYTIMLYDTDGQMVKAEKLVKASE